MRATDIVRQVLDLLDELEGPHDIEQDGIQADVHVHQNGDDDNRFKQILAMLDANSFGPLANSPNEVIAPLSAVTTDAGGGVNGPKHPADIRVKDPRGYE
jgi:hypothetical protein